MDYDNITPIKMEQPGKTTKLNSVIARLTKQTESSERKHRNNATTPFSKPMSASAYGSIQERPQSKPKSRPHSKSA